MFKSIGEKLRFFGPTRQNAAATGTASAEKKPKGITQPLQYDSLFEKRAANAGVDRQTFTKLVRLPEPVARTSCERLAVALGGANMEAAFENAIAHGGTFNSGNEEAYTEAAFDGLWSNVQAELRLRRGQTSPDSPFYPEKRSAEEGAKRSVE